MAGDLLVAAGVPERVRRLILRQGVYAVALVTYRHKPGEARDFWPSVVRSEDSLGFPTQALLHHLLTTQAQHFTPAAYARYAANAWNAHVQGKKLKILHPQSLGHPIDLLATPESGSGLLFGVSCRVGHGELLCTVWIVGRRFEENHIPSEREWGLLYVTRFQDFLLSFVTYLRYKAPERLVLFPHRLLHAASA